MNQPIYEPEIVELLECLFDGDFAAEDRTRLGDLLRISPESRLFYLSYMGLHSDLSWQAVDGRLRFSLETESSAGVERGQMREDRVELPVPNPQPRVLGFLSGAAATLNRPVMWSILGVGVLFCGYIAVISWGLRDGKVLRGVDNDLAIALVSGAADVHWSSETAPKASESSIQIGERLKIDAGVVELKLKGGVKLAISGPAEWMIDGDNRATLQRGKLVANVPHHAIGFTIETATAKIVDLGTEFGVLTDQNGSSEVQVFEGLVEVQSVGSRSNAPALRVGRGDKVIVVGNNKAPLVPHSTTEADLQRFEWAKSSMPGVARQIKATKPRLVWRPIVLQNATADFSQASYFDVGATIDGDLSDTNGWAIADLTDSSTEARTAVYETIVDALVNSYTITLSNLYRDSQHTLGKFRISVTTDPRDTFADGLSRDGDVTTNWIELAPIIATATNGTTLTINNSDNSILASGTNPNASVYTVVAVSPLLKVTGFRLEALADPSLPTEGPGRAPNGNFVLTEFHVDATAVPEPKPRQ